MKSIIDSQYAVPLMFALVLSGLLFWIKFRPEIQDVLRTAQNVLFGWMP